MKCRITAVLVAVSFAALPVGSADVPSPAADQPGGPLRAEIVNGDMEAAPRDGEPLPGWAVSLGKGSKVTTDAADPRQGKRCLLVESGGAAEVRSAPLLVRGRPYRAEKDETWRLCYWVRAEGAATGVVSVRHELAAATPASRDMNLNWYTLGGRKVGARTDWVRRDVLVELPKGAELGRIVLAVSGRGSLWCDDFNVERIGERPGDPAQPPVQLKRIVYLSHPLAIESQLHRNLRMVTRDPDRLFRLVEGERRIGERWLDEIRRMGPQDALLLNGMPYPPMVTTINGPLRSLWQAARERLGRRLVVTFAPKPEELGAEILRRFKAQGLTFDPATVATESWGQSFEGCVPNWGGQVAREMGLQRGFPIRFEMTFPDAEFAMSAEFLGRDRLANSDVYVYRLKDKQGRLFAIYFPTLVQPDQPPGSVALAAAADRLSFTTKNGETQTPPHTAGKFRVPLFVDCNGKPLYVWNNGLHAETFRRVLTTATVVEDQRGK